MESTAENRSPGYCHVDRCHHMSGKLFLFAEALHALASRWRRCHHKNGKLFLFAEALHALASRWRRCHHKNGKLFLFAEASLILWWQRLHN